MLRRWLAFLTICAVITAYPRVGLSDAAGPLSARLDTFIKAEMAAAKIPGVSVGVVLPDGSTYLQGYGEASLGRPMLPTTPMILGAVSMPVTATAVLQLADAGKIDLDAPVRQYLPWFRLADEQAAASITIRQLLTHTSGLGSLPSPADPAWTLDEAIYALREVQPAGAPGKEALHSNLNYNILGQVVQSVSGKPFGEYLQTQVFTPLQMNRSFTDEASAIKEFLAEGHQMWFGYPIAAQIPYQTGSVPSGYIVSSAADMARFTARLLSGDMGATTSLQGFTPTQSGGFRLSGETPNYHAELVLLPEQKAGFVLLSNVQHPMARGVFNRMTEGVAALLSDEEPARSGWFARSLRVTYGLGLLALLGLATWSLEGLRRWAGRLQAAGAGATRLALSVVGLQAFAGLAVSYGLPWITGNSWTHLQLYAPDLGRLLAVLVLANLAGAAGRVIIAIQTFRKQGGSWNSSQQHSERNTA